MKIDYLQQPKYIPLNYLCNMKGERTFEFSEDVYVRLSDNRILLIEKGFRTDLSSIPKILWSLFTPIDKAFIADAIHDKLWEDKDNEKIRFGTMYRARKFADLERKKWRNAISPEKKFKNWVTHLVIRLIGGFYYSGQIRIPE